jgi:hypothetical protein
MHRLVILASVMVLAASSVNCANSSEPGSPASSSVLAPSTLNGAVARFAAEGHGGSNKPGGWNATSSFTPVMHTDINGNGLPNWGDTVTFNVSTTATTEPHVDLTCSQDGVVVYGATTGYFASYLWPWTQFMTLSSRAWPNGAADCTATLYYFSGSKNTIIATLKLTAGA